MSITYFECLQTMQSNTITSTTTTASVALMAYTAIAIVDGSMKYIRSNTLFTGDVSNVRFLVRTVKRAKVTWYKREIITTPTLEKKPVMTCREEGFVPHTARLCPTGAAANSTSKAKTA